MKIKIKHLGTTVEIDEKRTDKTTIHFEHATINEMVTSTIESIAKNQPKPPERSVDDFRDIVTDIVHRVLDDRERGIDLSEPHVDPNDIREMEIKNLNQLIENIRDIRTFDGLDPQIEIVLKSAETELINVLRLRVNNQIGSVDPNDPEFTVTKKEVTEIHRNADECLRMLKYWDEHSLRNQGDEIVHPDIAESNTMKVVKSFLMTLMKNFPNK